MKTLIRLLITLKCLSIGTPKNNKFSICSKWKIHYFQVSPKFRQSTASLQCASILRPLKTLIFHLRQMEN